MKKLSEIRNTKTQLWKICLVALLLGASLLIFYHCPLLYTVGIPCPGCGMTRALFALLGGFSAVPAAGAGEKIVLQLSPAGK